MYAREETKGGDTMATITMPMRSFRFQPLLDAMHNAAATEKTVEDRAPQTATNKE